MSDAAMSDAAMSGAATPVDNIRLTGLRIFAHHGVLDFERENGQEFVIDLEIAVDLAPAAASDDADGEQTDVQGFTETSAEPADPDTVERVSRYNFDELARILTDRVGEPATVAPAPAVQGETTRTGALINLGGETLVLNRLPLGILVFRDQQVLFANRAITEMVG